MDEFKFIAEKEKILHVAGPLALSGIHNNKTPLVPFFHRALCSTHQTTLWILRPEA